MTPKFLFATAALLLAPTLSAQSPSGTGTVSGHVTLGDTQRPARFAAVILFGVPKEVKKPEAEPDPKDMVSMMAAVKDVMGSMNMVQGQSDLGGDFSLTNVTPGDYYAFASVPGYQQPYNTVQAMFEAGTDLSKPLPGVPLVHVAAEHTVQAQITVDRGAAIDGKFLWDDGTPVTRASIMLESVKKDKKNEMPKQFAMLAAASATGGGGLAAMTDDLGRFRIAGLASGEYYVHGSVQTHQQFALGGKGMDLAHMMANTPLVVYAPAAFHKSAAKSVTLRAGDPASEVLLTLNLNATHTVSGRIASAEEHHGINAATVKLTDTTDKEFSRSAGVDEQGNFSVTFVPSGTYDLEVSDAEDTEPSKKKSSGLFGAGTHTLRSYEDGKSSVIVADADVTGQNLELKPSKKAKEDLDMNELMKALTSDDDDKPKKP